MSKIKILPVYPGYPDTFWSFNSALKYVRKKALMPPTGLATVLSMMPEDKFDIHRIVDLNVEPLTDGQLKDTDMVFTSSMIVQEDSHNDIIARAKSYNKPVVAGGPFPTSYPERNQGVDYIVAGEAELTLPKFLHDLLDSKPRRVYTEENVKQNSENGNSLVQLTRTGRVDLRETPLPRWDLVNLNLYGAAAIQYSRGCPFDCDFCDITKLFGRESRTKTPDQMIGEFNYLFETGFRGDVFIVDDNFIGNKKNVMQLIPRIVDWQKANGYPFGLYTEASMNLAWDSNEELLENMVEAGFYQVFMGIESVDDEALKKMKKSQNTKMQPLKAVRRIQNAGLEVMGGFIVGSDGDSRKVFDELYGFIQEAGIPIAMPGLLTALKSTDLYNRLKSEGRLRDESTGNNTHNFSFNFKPLLDEKYLIEGYKELLRKLFNDQSFYERCRVLQDNLGENKVIFRKGKDKIITLAKSLYNNLRSDSRWHYSKHLLTTIAKHPRKFASAIAHTAKLEHLKCITNKSLEDDLQYEQS